MAKFRHTPAEADEAMGIIRGAARVVEITGGLRVVPDNPDDDKFIETAQVGDADLIVSGDRHLLGLGSVAGVPVATAREFPDRLGGLEV